MAAYAKNDHLGFVIHDMWKGSRRRYLPDFLVRLHSGDMLVLEIKGRDDDQNRAKRAALDAWIQGVNQRRGFGIWHAAVAFEPEDVEVILRRHAPASRGPAG